MRTARLGGLLAVTALLGGVAMGREDPADERLRRRLEAAPESLAVGDQPIHSVATVSRFYRERGFASAWTGPGGPRPAARALLDAVRRSAAEGLQPADYHADALQARLGAAGGDRVELELLLTDAFLIIAAHIVSGRVDPETFDPEWAAARAEVDLVPVLEEALASGRIQAALESLLPVDPAYQSLRDARERYRSLARSGGWEPLPAGRALQPGETSDRVATLRARLEATGDLAPGAVPGDPRRYDEALADAVRRFQARHGLEVDATVGPRTRAALNVSAADRMRQIELNMERWHWLPRDLGRRHVMVNIPAFRLDLVEEHHAVFSTSVIVGRAARRTPVMSDLISYLVLNPYWEVPAKLAVQDKLPLIRQEPAYLEREGYRVFRGWGSDQQEIDPGSVDWARLGPRSFPYRLRQDPGEKNALGRIKIMFPNKFNIYLHDTPGRELFRHADRDFSSGCIRVEHPFELAALLLQEEPSWTPEGLQAVVASGETRTVPVRPKVPVHLLYWTAWADDDGILQFRKDLYGRDALLDAALDLPPPEVNS